jgi:acetyl esterase/lipase
VIVAAAKAGLAQTKRHCSGAEWARLEANAGTAESTTATCCRNLLKIFKKKKNMIKLTAGNDVKVQKIKIVAGKRKIPVLVVSPKVAVAEKTCGVLWIHGGGYFLGMKEMVFMSRAMDLVKNYGVTVVSPGYRLAFLAPYPAAINDCYETLLWLKNHADELNVRKNQIMVGGESAGGGLAASLCMMARDRGEVNVAFQMPLYPMIDNFDTESSKNNHGRVWNTRRNHLGWKLYLRKNSKKEVSPYASAARQKDYTNLPPAYSFVGNGEPFYAETLAFIQNLKNAGVDADLDVYETDMHAFDMLDSKSDLARDAAQKFNEHFEYALKNYFAGE